MKLKRQLQIVIDTRENSKFVNIFQKEIIKTNIPFSIQQLPLADIIIIDVKIATEKPNDPYAAVVALIERKTLNDYAASIIDGRNKEQSIRLAEWKPNAYYLIEGNFEKDYNNTCRIRISTKTIKESITRKRVRDGFNVIQTQNMQESIEEIIRITQEYSKNNEPIQYTSDVICKKLKPKSEMKTPKLCYIAQLRCISGISETIAKKISEHYPNMISLINALLEGKDIASIQLNEKRKIGKSIVNKLKKQLLQQ